MVDNFRITEKDQNSLNVTTLLTNFRKYSYDGRKLSLDSNLVALIIEVNIKKNCMTFECFQSCCRVIS